MLPPPLRLTVRSLKHGTAPDALGWTTETWSALAARDDILPVLTQILVQCTTGHCGSIAQNLINLSQMWIMHSFIYPSSLWNCVHNAYVQEKI